LRQGHYPSGFVGKEKRRLALVTSEEIERNFLNAPDARGLVALYRALLAEGKDDLLAGVLDRIRPIQHRVTLVQADSDVETLEALARDPHSHVRRVVAAHARISEEVSFRLSEDQDPQVRLTLRKNPACHPFIAAAITVEDGPGRAPGLARAEHYLEAAWQARRAKLPAAMLMEMASDWIGLESRDDLLELTIEQMQVLFDVLAAHQGKGPMPSKPRRARGR
jgi:hypothetical protein